MKRILLDYDNTICDFNHMLVQRWNQLPGDYQKYSFRYEDITCYSLLQSLIDIGYTRVEAKTLLDNFWYIGDLYQTGYYDSKYRTKIFKLLKDLKKETDTYIELNTLCNTFIMSESKLKKIEEDKELMSLVDNVVMNTCHTYDKFNKSTDYTIVIDDNPKYITHYLEANPSGKVYMPHWIYNDYLLPNTRIISIKP